MSWCNACSTCMHKSMRCMHKSMRCMHQPVMSQAHACTYCMGSKVSNLSRIYLYSSYFALNMYNYEVIITKLVVETTNILTPNAIKNCRVTLQITLYFVTLGIKALNNFTQQFTLYNKSVNGIIFYFTSIFRINFYSKRI